MKHLVRIEAWYDESQEDARMALWCVTCKMSLTPDENLGPFLSVNALLARIYEHEAASEE
jgi:hypothetical protein